MRDDVRRRLIEVAKRKEIVTYGELMKEFGIPRGNPNRELGIGYVVGKISEYEHDNGRPMISAIVVHKGGKSIGGGFFDLARDLGRLTSQNERDFWLREQRRVWDYPY